MVTGYGSKSQRPTQRYHGNEESERYACVQRSHRVHMGSSVACTVAAWDLLSISSRTLHKSLDQSHLVRRPVSPRKGNPKSATACAVPPSKKNKVMESPKAEKAAEILYFSRQPIASTAVGAPGIGGKEQEE